MRTRLKNQREERRQGRSILAQLRQLKNEVINASEHKGF
jgi:hypothetical protein